MADVVDNTGNNNTGTQDNQDNLNNQNQQNNESEPKGGSGGEPSGTIAGGEPKPDTGAPGAYDFTGSLPEGAELDEETAKSFGEICRGMNLTNEQANNLAKYGYEYAGKIQEAAAAARDAEVASWGEATKKALGSKFDETVSYCGAGVEAMEKLYPGLRDALNETGAGNRLEIVQAFAELGKRLGEDRGTQAASGTGTDNFYKNTDWNNL